MVIKRLTEHFAIDGEMCYRVRGEVAVSWTMVEYMYGVNVFPPNCSQTFNIDAYKL
jgi:hypothetical protein